MIFYLFIDSNLRNGIQQTNIPKIQVVFFPNESAFI